MNGACAEQPLRTGEPMNSSDGCIPKAPRRNAEETISAVLAAPDPFTMLCLPLPTLDDLGRPASAITASDVSRNFRIVALSIHPDRCSLPGARQAFDALNKAHIQLRDDVTRAAAVREHAVRPGDADISASGSMAVEIRNRVERERNAQAREAAEMAASVAASMRERMERRRRKRERDTTTRGAEGEGEGEEPDACEGRGRNWKAEMSGVDQNSGAGVSRARFGPQRPPGWGAQGQGPVAVGGGEAGNRGLGQGSGVAESGSGMRGDVPRGGAGVPAGLGPHQREPEGGVDRGPGQGATEGQRGAGSAIGEPGAIAAREGGIPTALAERLRRRGILPT